MQEISKHKGDVDEHLTSSCTLVAPSDDNTVTRHADKDFKTVKIKKCSRKVRSDQTVIDTINRFESFNNPEFQVQEAKYQEKLKCYFPALFKEKISMVPAKKAKKAVIEDEAFTIVKANKSKRVVRCSKAKIPTSYKSVDFWKKFEGPNQYSILENNAEEDIEKIMKIIKMKKVLLKKCRSCNFKKRSCMLDRSSCPALQRTCFACKKNGHYPKSFVKNQEL